MNVPLTFLIDDILRTMAMNQKNYFVLNKENAKDGREHSFYFRVITEKECPRNRTYVYAGVKIVSSSELSAMNVSFLQHFMFHIMECFSI